MKSTTELFPPRGLSCLGYILKPTFSTVYSSVSEYVVVPSSPAGSYTLLLFPVIVNSEFSSRLGVVHLNLDDKSLVIVSTSGSSGRLERTAD